jgi:hypothetical protein
MTIDWKMPDVDETLVIVEELVCCLERHDVSIETHLLATAGAAAAVAYAATGGDVEKVQKYLGSVFLKLATRMVPVVHPGNSAATRRQY